MHNSRDICRIVTETPVILSVDKTVLHEIFLVREKFDHSSTLMLQLTDECLCLVQASLLDSGCEQLSFPQYKRLKTEVLMH